jgi:HJR/Mrr/RecB family endonuclease
MRVPSSNLGIRIAASWADMARRRRRDDDLVGLITAMAGFAVFAYIFIPGVRQMLFSIGIIALAFLGIVVVGFVVFGIFRLATPERNMRGMTRNVFAPSVIAPDQKSNEDEPEADRTPEPINTTAELLQQLRSIDWFQFEKVVGHMYLKLGYDVTRRGGANPDGGIDLIIQKDGQSGAVQCKHWKAWKVDVRTVREFLGALTDAGIQKGKLITLRGYTGEAKQLAEKHGIENVNETGLTRMIESTDARFDPEVFELLHDTRKFCPKCEREMVIKIAEKGPNPGSKFWGCSGYPRKCHFTLPIT